MHRRDEGNYRFPCTDITLKEASHRMGLLHIFQYLEEDDLLLIRESKWDIRDDQLHEIDIERNRGSESLTFLYSFVFLLDSSTLELEKFTVSELSLGSFEGIDRFRKVDISNALMFRSDSFLRADRCRDIVREFRDICLEESHFLSDPCARNIVHIRIDRDSFTAVISEMLDISTVPGESTVFVFRETIDDHSITGMELCEDHATIPPDGLRMESTLIREDSFDEELLIASTLLSEEFDRTLDRLFFTNIDQ